jgi:hypothetical protein
MKHPKYQIINYSLIKGKMLMLQEEKERNCFLKKE